MRTIYLCDLNQKKEYTTNALIFSSYEYLKRKVKSKNSNSKFQFTIVVVVVVIVVIIIIITNIMEY